MHKPARRSSYCLKCRAKCTNSKSIPRSKGTAWSAQTTTVIFVVSKCNARSAQTTSLFLFVPKKVMLTVHKQPLHFSSWQKALRELDQIISIRKSFGLEGRRGMKLFSFWLSLVVFRKNFIVEEIFHLQFVINCNFYGTLWKEKDRHF